MFHTFPTPTSDPRRENPLPGMTSASLVIREEAEFTHQIVGVNCVPPQVKRRVTP
jgi:hypothetical protein